ncbi:MAG: F0F1 ATP synthase subunit A [Micropruina sp.]|uniref:F0F1 ATP synthase subunit A n=1 Tax=Micropruina sp. TaxID=2737536 RepID=UPI0039E4CC19
MGRLSLILPLEGGGDESHWPPGVHSFDPRPLFPGAGVDWIDNHLFQAVLGAVLVVALWMWLARRHSTVPGKRQFAGESLYNLVRNGIARDVLGHEYRRFLPFLLALFTFILINNLFGQFFVFMLPTFSSIGFPYALALIVWIMYNAVGIKKWGFFGYVRRMSLPPGVPWPMWPILIPLEFLSNFVVRPVTLALRLFANLFAGHLLVIVFVVGGTMLVETAQAGLVVAGAASWLLSGAIFGLEMFVACLQAYIFTVLAAQYISSALAEEH